MPFETKKGKNSPRWLSTLHNGQAGTSTTLTAGTVYMQLFEVNSAVIVDQIVWVNGATVAGNVTAGIYGPLVTEDTAESAPLKVETASTAQSGVSATQAVSITETVLPPGRYYVCIEASDATATFLRSTAVAQASGWLQAYARSGGYGALTNPCPSPTTTLIAPGLRVRCKV